MSGERPIDADGYEEPMTSREIEAALRRAFPTMSRRGRRAFIRVLHRAKIACFPDD